MIKLLLWLIIALVVILAFFGFLILIEYLKYYKRKISLNLRQRLDSSGE